MKYYIVLYNSANCELDRKEVFPHKFQNNIEVAYNAVLLVICTSQTWVLTPGDTIKFTEETN